MDAQHPSVFNLAAAVSHLSNIEVPSVRAEIGNLPITGANPRPKPNNVNASENDSNVFSAS